MIRPDQIPDDVVEAAARAAFIYYKCVPWDECGDKTLWCRLARATIAAALAAWPERKWHEIQVPDNSGEVRYTLKKIGLILPLPTEKSDE